MLIEIVDRSDERLDPYRELKIAGATRWNRPLIAEGWRVVRRAISSGWTIESMLVSERRLAGIRDEIPPGVPVWCVSQELAESLAGFNFHAGVAAHLRRPRPWRYETWVEGLEPKEARRGWEWIVGFPRMSDPENVGLVMRSAAAFGVKRLLVGSGSADPMGRRSLRLSMGAAFKQRILRTARFGEVIERLKGEFGCRVVGAVCERGSISVARWREGLAGGGGLGLLLLGNESEGLSREELGWIDERVTIPIATGIDSLNVTTAAAILLYELTRGDFCAGNGTGCGGTS